MKNAIITIARQYGSGGREVGEKLAEMLGYRFYDKDLITMAARKSGLNRNMLDEADEKAANSLLYTLAMGSSVYHHGMDNLHIPLNDKLFSIQCEIIRDLAKEEEGAVIVGRCADYVLENDPRLVRVFICGDFEKRVSSIMQQHSLTEGQAKDLVIKTDKRRANYYSYYTGDKWGKNDKYDLVVNTERIGIDTAANLIADYLKMLGGNK